jgi:tRNA(Ile)-lysidine synthase
VLFRSLVACAHAVLPVVVQRSGEGVEADARRARHWALEDEADRIGARLVGYGHHAEDQAETLLLRLARGSGIDGLAGMAPLTGRRLRPLLDVRRADLHRVAGTLLAGALDGAAHDPMNDDVDLARVRLRGEVLPGLARLAPDPVGAIARLATLARAESDLLERMVDEQWSILPVVRFGRATLVPSAGLRVLPDALARRLLRRMLTHGDVPGAATVERLLRAPDGWRATLPGPLDASVDRGWHLVLPGELLPGEGDDGAARDVPVDDAVVHPPSRMTLTAARTPTRTLRLEARLDGGCPPGIDPSRLTVQLRTDAGAFVRSRRDGDRVRTPGGTRTLGDVLADAGVPAALRDLLPVVVDADGRVLWVPGVVVDAELHDRP